MTTTAHLEAVPTSVAEIPLQPASQDIWDKKYRLKTKNGTPVDETIDDLPARRPCTGRCRDDPGGPGDLVPGVPVGAAPRRDSGRAHHLQCRRPGAQAGHLDHQLHGLGHREGLHERHPGEGARGRPDAEGRLRHRLRVLDPAPEGCLRVRRRCLHLRSAVVHGYLRQDVLHGVLGRRSSRCADGHLRHRPPGRHGLHPCQARGRPAAPVQPVAADHDGVHGCGQGRRRLATGVSHQPAGTGRGYRPERTAPGGLARLARTRATTSPTTPGRSPAGSTRPFRRNACGT